MRFFRTANPMHRLRLQLAPYCRSIKVSPALLCQMFGEPHKYPASFIFRSEDGRCLVSLVNHDIIWSWDRDNVNRVRFTVFSTEKFYFHQFVRWLRKTAKMTKMFRREKITHDT